MALINGFFIKGATSLLTAFMGATTIYYSNDYLENQLTKYDRALIDYLEAGGRIKFKVERQEINGTIQEITNQFPRFSSGEAAPLIISVSVSTEDSKNQLLDPSYELSDPEKIKEREQIKRVLKVKKENLKKLNGGSSSPRDWTWRCLIKLHRSGENVDSINELIKRQRQVLKWEAGEEKGRHFFDHMADGNTTDERETAKIKFVRDCGYTRAVKVNRMINSYQTLESDHLYITVSNEIEAHKDFHLVKIKNHSDPNNLLIFKYWREFDHWFDHLND